MQKQHDALLAVESRLVTVNQMIHFTGQYYANKDVYKQFLHAKNKHQFRQEHEPQILLYEASRKELRALYGDSKLRSIRNLKEEKSVLTKRKNELYEDYSFSRSRCHQLQTVIENVELILQSKEKPLAQDQENRDKNSPDR